MENGVEGWRVDAFNKLLESALDKGLRLERSGALADVLRDFESALEFMPNSKPVLECCAMIRLVLGDKSAARELYVRANRNQDGQVSENAAIAQNLVRTEFFKWSMYQRMTGKQMQVTFEKTLPDLPPKFERNSGPQVFKGTFHFTPTIKRVADDILVTMTPDHVEIGVSNFLSERDFQGYFIHAFEIDISPSTLWKPRAKLSTVKALDMPRQPLVQQQQSTGYVAQIAIGGDTFIPNFTAQYSASEAVSTFTQREVIRASKDHEDENVMKCAWMVKTYTNGMPFVLGPVWDIQELPYPPRRHEFSFPFQGTWVMPVSAAIELEYMFEWKIQLKAKFALFERTLKRKFGTRRPGPHTDAFEPHFSILKSDFGSASTAKMFEF